MPSRPPSPALRAATAGLVGMGFLAATAAALAAAGRLPVGAPTRTALIFAAPLAMSLALALSARSRRPDGHEPPGTTAPEAAPPAAPPATEADDARQLLQTEKLASLGRMAAGVAHEFNNPAQHLVVNLPYLRRGIDRLRSVLEVALAHPPEDEHARERFERAVEDAKLARTNADLDEILEGMNDGATKIGELVRDLTTFSRLDSAEVREVDLHDGIDAAVRLLGYRFKDRVRVHRDYGELPAVRCHPGQVNQIFMNLLSNAADAIPEHGNVWIATEPCAEGVRVRVTDDGVGLDAETLGRVFDPFFTTKEPGQGTGLGLTLSHEIARRHGGDLSVLSEPGTGTVFTLVLPVDARDGEST